MQPTLRDVAETAGVSLATASRALSNDAHVSARTRSAVRAAAEKLGYRPSPVMAALSTRRRGLPPWQSGTPLAVVSSEMPGRPVAGDRIQTLITGQAAQLGYAAVFYRVKQTGGSPERFIRMLQAKGTAGVLFRRLFGDFAFFQQADWSAFSVVNMASALQAPRFDTVRSAIFQDVGTVAAEVAARGYRKPGCVLFNHSGDHPDDRLRRAAAREWFGARCPVFEFRAFTPEPPEGLAQWLRRGNLDVVVGFNSAQLQWLQLLGYRVPEQIGFAALTGPGTADLSGIEPREPDLVNIALRRLDEHFRHGIRGIPEVPVLLTVPGKWREGKTLPVRSGKL